MENSKQKFRIISEETYQKVLKWNEDCERKDIYNDLVYTDGDMCEKAQDVIDSIIKDCNEGSN